jgi:hypothetical protein
MKRVIRMLARLYPAPWRARYGAEFDQLIADSNVGWRDVWNVVGGAFKMQFTAWGYGRFVVAGIAIGIIAATVTAYSRQPQWRSEAVMQSSVKGSPAATWDEVTLITRAAVNRSSLTGIIQAQDLYLDERRRLPLEDVLENMRRHIWVAPVLAQPGEVSIQYEYPDRFAAQRVVAELMSDMIRANVDVGHGIMQPITAASLPEKPFNRPPLIIATVGLLSGPPVGLLAGYIVRRRPVKA